MKHIPAFVFLLGLFACDSHSFDSDKRQIIAKDEISRQIPRNRSLSITGFREDTLRDWPDSSLKHPLSYSLDFLYVDSNGTVQKKEGVVVFAPGGTSVINSKIIDRP